MGPGSAVHRFALRRVRDTSGRSVWTAPQFPADMRRIDATRPDQPHQPLARSRGGNLNDPNAQAPLRRSIRAHPCGRLPGLRTAARTQGDGARGPRRRMGSDRARDAAGACRSQDRAQRAGDERGRCRRQRRHRAVRQRRQGRRQPDDGERLCHGRRARHEQVARHARSGDADRAPHRGNPGHRRSGKFADQDRAGSRQRAEGRHCESDLCRRFGRRRRPCDGGAVCRRGRRRREEGQLHSVFRRRRIARRHPRRKSQRGHFGLERI